MKQRSKTFQTIQTIRKRSGEVVPFDAQKIHNAIFKANIRIADERMSDDMANALLLEIITAFPPESVPAVEQIQDVVEEKLIRFGYAKTAKAYILYRAEHAKIREMDANLMQIYEDLTFKTSAEADIKRENANIDANTAMGTMLKYGSEGAKSFYDAYLIPKEMVDAHRCGDIHIHDKDFYALTETCCQIDLVKLFEGGFSTGHGFLREPNDIRSYAALACIAIQANQNEMHGGQSVPNFDYAMAVGVGKTYAKEYKKALSQYLQIAEVMDAAEADALCRTACEQIGSRPAMGTIDVYGGSLVAELMSLAGLSAESAKKAHAYAKKTAWKETDRATYQAMEALIHNLNTMNSRAGAQVPFSSLNYGTDTSPEGRMAMRNILEATERGMGDGETPIFPIQIFKVKEGVNYNEGDPNYDLFQLSMRVSAKRLFPNFSFIDAPYNLQYYKEGRPETEIAYMGCRTRVIGNDYDKDNEVVYGRGNLSFTSINLPRLALEARGSVGMFYNLLGEKMDLVIEQLLHRFKIQCSKKAYNYPFLMGQGVWIHSDQLQPSDSVAEVLKNGTLSIGFIGLAETLKVLTGKHHGESEESQKLGLEIIGYMRRRMDDETARRGLNFSLLATPAEGLSGRFVKIDRMRYGEIPGVTDKDYYTNSFHVPVYYPIKAYKKIALEAPYHALTNAGHISYVELDGDTCKNIDAFESVIRCMKEAGIGYGSVNHPVDRDPVCGYNGIIENECPKCGRKESDGGPRFERIRRITGYLVGTTDRWNNAKRAEEHDRVKHGLQSK